MGAPEPPPPKPNQNRLEIESKSTQNRIEIGSPFRIEIESKSTQNCGPESILIRFGVAKGDSFLIRFRVNSESILSRSWTRFWVDFDSFLSRFRLDSKRGRNAAELETEVRFLCLCCFSELFLMGPSHYRQLGLSGFPKGRYQALESQQVSQI